MGEQELNAKIKKFLGTRQDFNIIEVYAALSAKRKVLLCDNLFVDGRSRFQNMVKLMWPQATNYDIKKLEKFLNLIRVSSH